MKLQKQLTAALAGAAFFGSVANAEIPLTDELSAYGYIDMALTDGDDAGDTETTVAEFELGLAFTPAESKWSAVAELSFDSDSTSTSTTTRGNGVDGLANTADDTFTTTTETNSDTEFETVTITYAYSDELSFTAGNILTYQGFETYDATGLYQFSYAGAGGDPIYSAGYAVGACADYVTDAYALGVWIGDADDSNQSYEFLAAYTGVENLTVKVIYADDPGYETINAWASYDYNDFTFAVETVTTEDGDGVDVLDVQTALVYYSFGSAGITVRYAEGDYNGVDYEKFTISPSYSFSDNVFGLVEFSSEELGGVEQDTFAAELIYSF
jgi:hypothetical protein